MTREILMEKLRKTTLPPHQRIALGLNENWQEEKINSEIVEKVVEVKIKHHRAFEELKKY